MILRSKTKILISAFRELEMQMHFSRIALKSIFLTMSERNTYIVFVEDNL